MIQVEEKMESAPIPKLDAPSKDTARTVHRHHQRQESPTTSNEGEEGKKMGLRRCHTTDGATSKRISPAGRRTKKLSPTSSSSNEDRHKEHRTLARSHSSSPKRSGEKQSPHRRRHRPASDTLDSPPSSSSPSGRKPRRRSPSGEQRSPIRSVSGTSNSNSNPGERRPRKHRSPAAAAAAEAPRRPLGTIESRRQKSARNLGLRRTKSLDEQSGDQVDMAWRRVRRDMMNKNNNSNGKLDFNASTGRLDLYSSRQFLESSAGVFMGDGSEISIDVTVQDDEVSIDTTQVDGNNNNKNEKAASNSPPEKGSTTKGRGTSPRTRGNKQRSDEILRNQLARGIELQDRRLREEEEQERKQRVIRKERSARSVSPKGTSRGEEKMNKSFNNLRSETNSMFKLSTGTKIVLPTVNMTGTAVAASQAATQAANRAAANAAAAASAASATANQMAVGATTLMTRSAASAAAAITFTGTKTSTGGQQPPLIGPTPKPDKTISEREVSDRLARVKASGSSQFRGSTGNSPSELLSSKSSQLRGSTDSSGHDSDRELADRLARAKTSKLRNSEKSSPTKSREFDKSFSQGLQLF